MVLPTSHSAGLTLLFLTLVSLACWPILYKRSNSTWRFELFGIDFGFGALLFSILAAYTLGTLGSEMSFLDRMLIAGRTADAVMIGAGILFAFANLTLLAGISLLGLSLALPVEFGVGAAVLGAFQLRGERPGLAGAGAAVAVLCALLAGVAGHSVAKKTQLIRSTKGLVLAALGGLALGCIPAVLKLTFNPDFGPGPYSTILMLSVGILLGTPAFNFFFMHIQIVGSPIGNREYVRGGNRPHWAGVSAGACFAAGTLCWLLTLNMPNLEWPGPLLTLLIPGIFVLVCVAAGAVNLKELGGRRTSKILVAASIACFAASLALIGLSFTPLPL